MFNVKFISRETIKPSRPTPEHLRYLQASLFDHESIPILMPLIFFFSPKKNTTITIDRVLDRLKGALPETLSVFYPLAGRAKAKDHIACNDEGVPYVAAKVIGACLKDIVHKAEVSQLDLFLPSDGQEGYSSLLLAIQVTSFSCGGVAIGVKMSHAISDAFSLLMFVKAWAAIANHGKGHRVLVEYPFFEISKMFPPPSHGLSSCTEVSAEPNPELLEPGLVTTKRFVFTQAKLDAIRSKLYNNSSFRDISKDNSSLPSLPMVLSSLILSRMKVACQDGTSGSIPYEVYHAVNIRPKVSAPKQCYYFGNMVVNAIVKPTMKQGDSSANNKEYILCCNFLDQMKESTNRIISDDRFIKGLQEGTEDLRFMMDHFERDSRGEVASLGFSNLRSLPVYEADFGWGEPVWVTSATLLFQNIVIMIPCRPSSKDVEAYINLSYEDMVKLETDSEFLSYVSVAPSASSKFSTAASLKGPRFSLRTFPDGLPEDHPRGGEKFMEMLEIIKQVGHPLLREMVITSRTHNKNTCGLSTIIPPVTCIISDGLYNFALDVGKEAGIQVLYFETMSPSCLLVYLSLPSLIQRGEVPFRAVSWAPQEQVLSHPAVGGFLTHSGWNSTMESIAKGVPMACWPHNVDQLVTSRLTSEVWKLGVDIKDTCDRATVKKMVNDLMDLRRDDLLERASEFAKLARQSVNEGGSSHWSLELLIDDLWSFKFSKPNQVAPS